MSHGTTRPFSKIRMIFRRTSIQYFLYRVFIQLISRFTQISDLAGFNYIKLSTLTTKSDLESLIQKYHYMGVTCNFDLIIPHRYIQSRRGGVLNERVRNESYGSG